MTCRDDEPMTCIYSIVRFYGQACSREEEWGSRCVDKWMLRLDSAGEKGPEITLEGILIVVEGCLRQRKLVDQDQNTLPPMAPVFLHISSKLPREILEQLCVYCRNLQEFARFMCQEVRSEE